MSPSEANAPNSPTASDDPRVVHAVKEYLALVEAGRRPDRQAFLARHADVALELAKCLAGLEFVHAVAGDLRHPDGAGPTEFEPSLPLGDYRIVREVGRGGMGIVYEAEQLSLGRRVALKVLPFAASLDPRQLQRFKNEAQAVAHLHHTNIVPVYAVGSDRGVYFFAMQFIDGRTLAAVIDELQRASQGPSPADDDALDQTAGYAPPDGRGSPVADTTVASATNQPRSNSHRTTAFFRSAAQLGLQAAEALEHAHQMGVVHRDVKPANLLIDVRGNLWVTDFGLARFHADTGLTMSGDLVGTLRYLSPEQALGGASVDHRTDVYSLGVTLYELLTLAHAFPGPDRQEILQQIAHVEPRAPRKVSPAIPAELETIVLKAMAKVPEERYGSAQDLADDLRRWLEDRPIRARRPSLFQVAAKFLRRHRAIVRTAGLVALLALAVGAFLLWQEKDRTAAQKANAEQERDRATANLEVSFAVLGDLLQVVENQATRGLTLPDEDRQLLEKALAFYEEFDSKNRDAATVGPELIRANGRIGDIHRLLGRPKDAVRPYQRAVELSERLAADQPDNLKSQLDLMASLARLGSLHHEMKQSQDAEKLFERCLAVGTGLVVQAPRDPDYLSALSNVHFLQANLHYDQQRWQEADHLLHQAVVGQQAALAGRPKDDRFREALRNQYELLGSNLRGRGKLAEAEGAYNSALTLSKGLLEDHPRRPKYRLHLANVYNHRGLLRAERKQPEDAEKDFHLSINSLRELMRDFPTVPAYRQQLALGIHNLGLTFLNVGRPADAVRVFCETIELRQRLAADYPASGDYRTAVNVSSDQLNKALKAIKKPNEAIDAYRHALDTVGQLWKRRFPEVVKGRYQTASWHLLLAIELQNAGQLPESEQQHLTAQEMLNALIAKFPRELPYRRDKAGSLVHLADVCNLLQGQTVRAARLYQEAATIYQSLEKDDLKEPTYRQARGTCSFQRANQLRLLGRAAEAEELLISASTLQRSIGKDFSPRPEYRRQLAKSLYALGKLYEEELRRPDKALANYREVQTIQEALVKEHPDDPLDALALADTHTGLGVLYNNVLRQHEKAVASFEEGRKLREKVARSNPKNRSYQYYLANSCMNLGGTFGAVGNFPQAEKAYVEALKVQKPLCEAEDAAAFDRQQLGWILKGMADTYYRSNQVEKAKDSCLEAHAICQKLASDHPGRIPYAVDLINTLVSLANTYQRLDKSRESLLWYGRAITQATAVLAAAPRHETVRAYQYIAYRNRARLLDSLERHAEALRDWDFAVETADTAPPSDRQEVIMARIWSLALAGDHARTSKEAASRTAAKTVPIQFIIQSARIQAYCSKIARRDGRLSEEMQKKRSEEYVTLSLKLLDRAREMGFFKDATNRKLLSTDSELAPLRERAEFKKLISDP